ncbi:hypothetical protein KA183_07515 [bacterium]|nr:hypothetical protein [bacterium]QQR58309.1 MAG: hypothetical protein IPG59_02110 [Candidatus Melainabacteria bacterium]
MSINQRSFSYSFEAREDGFHDLIFGSDYTQSNFIPPDAYVDKLSWLQSSLHAYLSSVNELESLKTPSVAS